MPGGEGAEVIYALRNNEKLSQKILNELASSGQIIRKYYQKRGTSNPNTDYYYMLRNTAPYESVIVEYGFLDNAKDASKLKNNYKQYALDVVDAVLDYKGYIPEDVDYYIVKKGDSLYSIAKKYGTTVDKLKSLNNLTSNNLAIGQSLLVKDNVEVTIPEPPVGDYYTVKKGDTLYGIANMYSMSVNELKSLNNITSDILSVGQVLKVKQGTTPEEPIYENVYVVKPGDTLYSIANKNNTNVNTLMELNNLSSSMISVNQKLILPSKNYYTVQKGDTLYAIANKNNTTVDNLKDLNNLSSNLLSIGQKIIIP